MLRLFPIVRSLVIGTMDRFSDWTAYQENFLGIELRVDGFRSEAEVVLPKLKEALGLIQQHAPFRLTRVLRVVRCIRVGCVPHVEGQWRHKTRTCMLHLDFVCSPETAVEQVASVIIHEATHGRIRDTGIKYGEDKRVAVERACLAEEIRFLRRLPPGSEELIVRVQEMMDYPASFWSNASRRAHTFATARLKLKESGCPQWLMWPLLKLLDRKEKHLEATEAEKRSHE